MEADTCLLTSSFRQDAHTPLPVEAVVSASCSKCCSSAILFEDGDLPSTRQCCLMAAKGGPKNKQIGIVEGRELEKVRSHSRDCFPKLPGEESNVLGANRLL